MLQPVRELDSDTCPHRGVFANLCEEKGLFSDFLLVGAYLGSRRRFLRSFGTVRVLTYYDLEAEFFDEKHSLADNYIH